MRSPVSGTIAMQSTGHTGTHSSQPVHSGSITVCMAFDAPTMQSTGQALMHSVQPMHQASSMTASARGPSLPQPASSGTVGRPVIAARRTMPSAPPGGQRLMSARPSAIASA